MIIDEIMRMPNAYSVVLIRKLRLKVKSDEKKRHGRDCSDNDHERTSSRTAIVRSSYLSHRPLLLGKSISLTHTIIKVARIVIHIKYTTSARNIAHSHKT